jgi:hypothetical protein
VKGKMPLPSLFGKEKNSNFIKGIWLYLKSYFISISRVGEVLAKLVLAKLESCQLTIYSSSGMLEMKKIRQTSGKKG